MVSFRREAQYGGYWTGVDGKKADIDILPETVDISDLLDCVRRKEVKEHVELLCAGMVAVRYFLHDSVRVLAVDLVL